MILKNKRTRETLEITYQEFRIRFAKEIQRIFGRAESNVCERARKVSVGRYSADTPNNPRQISFESYRKTQLNKHFYNFQDDNSIEYNFYFQIQYNFNSFGNSAWYIEKI